MSISKFYNAAVANDFARTFQFRVDAMSFQPIAGGKRINFTYDTGSGQNLFIETANLPGRIVNNIPVPFMGLSFNVPGTASFPGSNNYPIVFRCDQNYAIRAKLEQALVDVFNISQTAGNYNTPAATNYITMTLFNKTQGQGGGPVPQGIRKYTLVGAYLIGLGDTLYDVKDTGNVALINATIGYQYWTVASGSTTVGVESVGQPTKAFTQGDTQMNSR